MDLTVGAKMMTAVWGAQRLMSQVMMLDIHPYNQSPEYSLLTTSQVTPNRDIL